MRAMTATMALLLAVSAFGQFSSEPDATEISLSGKTAESVILTWPTFSYRLARLMIEKYGPPDKIGDGSLTWTGNAPWKRTIVHRLSPERTSRRNKGRLEQSVVYRVPQEKLTDLAAFDPDLEVDEEDGYLTARSDAESENFLRLNLARDVIEGRRAAREASLLRQRLGRLRESGKSSPYVDGLMFESAE